MKCMRCGEEMRNTIGDCYICDNCGFGVNDLVLRCETKNGKTAKETNVIDGKDLIGTGKITDVIIDGKSCAKGEVWDKTTNVDAKDLGTLGAYFEADAAQKKIKELEHQLAEKDKYVEFLWRKNAMLGKENDIIRHQVCEEIRKAFEFWYDNYNIQDIRLWFQMQSFLKLAEKGEKCNDKTGINNNNETH